MTSKFERFWVFKIFGQISEISTCIDLNELSSTKVIQTLILFLRIHITEIVTIIAEIRDKCTILIFHFCGIIFTVYDM